jgi:hypothetical protein
MMIDFPSSGAEIAADDWLWIMILISKLGVANPKKDRKAKSYEHLSTIYWFLLSQHNGQ